VFHSEAVSKRLKSVRTAAQPAKMLLPENSRFLGPLAAGVVLIAFWIGLLFSLREKSLTLDEGVHVAAGYAFWRFDDYRLNPENGNLPERVMALPLLFGDYKFPPTNSDAWRNTDKWTITWQWFYQLGNDADEMTRYGRGAIGLLAVALGALVWGWSRQLFGPVGAMLSLFLYVLNPSILANGGLMTSDTAAALFFLAATWSWWRLLHRFTVGRFLISALVMGALFLSKTSALLILPIAVVLVLVRVWQGRPLQARLFGLGELPRRGMQFLAFAAAGVAHFAVVLLLIWAFHGFRYVAFSPAMPDGAWNEATWETLLAKPAPKTLLDRLELSSGQGEQIKSIFARERVDENSWSAASFKALDAVKHEVLAEDQASRLEQSLAEPPAEFFARVVDTMRRHHLLPEAYIYGIAHVWRGSRERAAFFNGEFGVSGWRTFFPYTFLVKTPLPVFAVIGLAIAGAVTRSGQRKAKVKARDSGPTFYDTLPLWVLLAVYWCAAISSHLNIGHRHLLPTYPPLCVLCGAAGWWLRAWPRVRSESTAPLRFSRSICIGLCVALALLPVEAIYRFPHYLAYFNGLVRPADGYRHVVDSSLDWGQDLPGVRRYIETKHPATPIYLSYFGFANPAYYEIPAIHTYSVTGAHRSPPLQTFTLSAERAQKFLEDLLRREPDYDAENVVAVDRDGTVFAAVVKKPAALRLTGGTYFISATLLQPVTQPGRGAFGPWNTRLENRYQAVRGFMAPLLSDEVAERRSALTRLPLDQWYSAINDYEFLRFHRLAAFLRQREPDDNVGFSILVYHLSDDDLAGALDGPPVELGRDLSMELFGGRR
jgi:4-amino-4-deoxy-L-arabinose transferase-like glycosyltransferase